MSQTNYRTLMFIFLEEPLSTVLTGGVREFEHSVSVLIWGHTKLLTLCLNHSVMGKQPRVNNDTVVATFSPLTILHPLGHTSSHFFFFPYVQHCLFFLLATSLYCVPNPNRNADCRTNIHKSHRFHYSACPSKILTEGSPETPLRTDLTWNTDPVRLINQRLWWDWRLMMSTPHYLFYRVADKHKMSTYYQ